MLELEHPFPIIEEHYLEASGEGYFRWNPTHWMPLPTKPKE